MRKYSALVGYILAAAAWLAACSGIPGIRGQPTPFQAPTLAAPLGAPAGSGGTPSPSPLAEALHPTVTPACVDGLTFLEDLSIPDGTQARPGETLDKRWLVENSGTCNWDQQYRLKLVSGPDMGALKEQALYPARGGTRLTIALQFTAPSEPGQVRSAWQAYNPQGEAFGDPFYIDIVVEP